GLVLENFRKAAGERKATAAPVDESLRFVEKSLVSILVGSPEARERLIPRLKEVPLEGLATRGIFQALIALTESGAPFGFAELDGRLEEADRRRLAAIAFGDETESGIFSLEQGEASLRALESQARDGRAAALRSQVKDAERSGDVVEALRLTGELELLRSKRYNDRDLLPRDGGSGD
ncbi:MAG: hypothetical protein ACRD96_16060, partial [Bryobacteraceae bacterium]